MAEDKIDLRELVETTAFKKELEDILDVLKEMRVVAIKAVEPLSQGFKHIVDPKDVVAVDKLNDEVNRNYEARKRVLEIEKLEAEAKKQLIQLSEAELKLSNLRLKELKAQEVAIQKEAKAEEKKRKEIEASTSAYKQASDRLNQLRSNYKDLAIAGNASTAELAKMKNEIQELDKRLKEVDAETGQHIRTVGDYRGAIQEALSSTGEFGSTLNGIKDNLATVKETLITSVDNVKALADSFRNTEGAVGKSKKALKLFGSALKASGIAILVTVLASAVAFFKSTEEGGDILGKVTAQIKAGFQEIVRTLATAFPFIAGFFGDIMKYAKAAVAPIILLHKSVYGLAKLLTGGGFDYLKNSGKEFVDAFKDLGNTNFRDNINGIANAFSGLGDRLSKTTDEAGKLFEALDDFGKPLRLAERNIERLNAQETLLAKTVGDSTNSFKERTEAEEKLSKIALKRATIENFLAQKEYEFAKRQLALDAGISVAELNTIVATQDARGQVTEERLAELLEVEKKTIQSEANLKGVIKDSEIAKRGIQQESLLTREKIIQEQTDLELASIKLIAESQDEPFSVRRQAIADFNNVSNKAYEEEIRLINEQNGNIIDSTKLLTITSGTELDQYIESLNIKGKKVEKELSDIVGRRKKALAEEQAIVKKLEDDIAKIEERNSKARNSISQENTKRRLEVLANQAKGLEVKQIKEITKNITSNYDIRRQALIDQANFELKTAKLTADEKRLIETKLTNDLVSLEEEKNANIAKANEALRQANEAQRQKRIDEVNRITTLVANAATQELEVVSQKRQQMFDREMQQREQNITLQQSLFNSGLANQLDFEKKQRDKALLEQRLAEEKAAKQREAIQLAQATIDAYISLIKKPNYTPQRAFAESIASTVVLKEGVKALVQGAFFEGTERVGDSVAGKPMFTGKDGYLIRADKDERIMTGQQNSLVGGLTNDSLANIAYDFNRGLLSYDKQSVAVPIGGVSRGFEKQFNEFMEEFKSRPTQVISVNDMNMIVEKLVKKNQVTTTVYKEYKRAR